MDSHGCVDFLQIQHLVKSNKSGHEAGLLLTQIGQRCLQTTTRAAQIVTKHRTPIPPHPTLHVRYGPHSNEVLNPKQMVFQMLEKSILVVTLTHIWIGISSPIRRERQQMN